MNTMFVSIGSNSLDRQWQMSQAVKYLKTKMDGVLVSTIYETSAINGVDAPYFNAVVFAKTELDLDSVMTMLKQWEVQCGRTSLSKLNGVVPIDLDIVVWNNQVLREKDFSYSYFKTGYNELIESWV